MRLGLPAGLLFAVVVCIQLLALVYGIAGAINAEMRLSPTKVIYGVRARISAVTLAGGLFLGLLLELFFWLLTRSAISGANYFMLTVGGVFVLIGSGVVSFVVIMMPEQRRRKRRRRKRPSQAEDDFE